MRYFEKCPYMPPPVRRGFFMPIIPQNAPTGAGTNKMPLYERTIKTILRGRAGVKTHAHKYNKSKPLMFFNTKISQKVLVIEKTAVILSADNKTKRTGTIPRTN